jgi:nucleoside-diphosphate-sugar epimerase
MNTGQIMEMLSSILKEEAGTFSDVLTWHPETDYLGNHRLSSRKFRAMSGWEPKISLEEGIRRTIREIRESEGYDPLVHLDEAKEKGVDLTDFY